MRSHRVHRHSVTDADGCVFFEQIELLDIVALNLHRIDKDVQRCDRNYYYFSTANLEKLRNIMCRYDCLVLHPVVQYVHIRIYLCGETVIQSKEG